MSLRGFQGLQGPAGPTGPTGPAGPSAPTLVIASVSGNNVYLNSLADEYLINFSPNVLGSALDTSTSPPTWTVTNILAGTAPSSGIVPSSIFNFFHSSVRLLFQNVSGVPINLVLANDSTNLTMFVYNGGSASSSYVVQPMSFLAIDAIFTNNSFIRFVSVYLDDNLEYTEVANVMNNAAASSYYPSDDNDPSYESLIAYLIEDLAKEEVTSFNSDTSGNVIVNVASQELNTGLVLVNVVTSNFSLTIDGSGISSSPYGASSGAMIMAIRVASSGSGTLTVSNLNNQSSGAYAGSTITLAAGKNYFATVVGGNVYIIDALFASVVTVLISIVTRLSGITTLLAKTLSEFASSDLGKQVIKVLVSLGIAVVQSDTFKEILTKIYGKLGPLSKGAFSLALKVIGIKI